MFTGNNFIIAVILDILGIYVLADFIYNQIKFHKKYCLLKPVNAISKPVLPIINIFLAVILILITLHQISFAINVSRGANFIFLSKVQFFIYTVLIAFAAYFLLSKTIITDKGILTLGLFKIPLDIVTWAEISKYIVNSNTIECTYTRKNKERRLKMHFSSEEEKSKILFAFDRFINDKSKCYM